MALQVLTLLVFLAVGRLEATLQRDILTFINDLRALHSAGPLISSPTATAIAQKAAAKLAKDGDTNAVYNSQFSTNHCVFKGKLSHLAKTCTVAWYTTMRDHSWCSPRANGKSRPFVNMVWNTTSRAGTGISKGQNGKYYVVTYFSPKKGSDVKGNVHPLKIVTKASPKATCTKGFTRFGSSCFKFHPEKVSWEQAVTICAKENATLTSVRNQKEEKFLRILQERGKGKGWMWIGLHDRTDEGHFAWLDGLEFAHGVCAPVSSNGGKSQNCVAWTTRKPISCWSDKTCTDRYPFMCRMPVEGKSTFRTEILFMKFRWNPNFRNKNSKAFRDLRRGLRVTFNEVFQRSSGRIGGGFRSLKVKSVRPLSIKGKRRGTAVTLSIQFRAKVADPTLKFQKFLRPNSERLISITVDSPVVHQSAISRTMCSFPCRRKGNHYCHSWSYYSHNNNVGYHNTAYQNTGYQQPSYTGYDNTGYQCPSSCSQYSYNSCPSYCTSSCCTQASPTTSSPTAASPTAASPTAASPTQAQPTATQPPTKAKPVVPTAVAYATAPTLTAANPPATSVNQWGSYSSYQPYSQCGTCVYSSPYCYSFCDETCCKHPKDLKSLKETVKDLRQHLKKFQGMVKYGKTADLPESVTSNSDGNAVPIFGNKAKEAVRILKRNIAKLEAKIRLKQQKLKGRNVDDLLFEKAIKKAEKKNRNNNDLPDFEKELKELDNDADNIDFENLHTTNVSEEDAEKDMEKFELREDENNDHESENTENKSDVEAIEYKKTYRPYEGPTNITRASGNDYGRRKPHSLTTYSGPQTNSSRNDYEETRQSSSAYSWPSTNTSTSDYENEHHQVIKENGYNERDYRGPETTATVDGHNNIETAPSSVSYSGPTTNISTESYEKSNFTTDDLNYQPKIENETTPNHSSKSTASTDVYDNNGNEDSTSFDLHRTTEEDRFKSNLDKDIQGANYVQEDNVATSKHGPKSTANIDIYNNNRNEESTSFDRRRTKEDTSKNNIDTEYHAQKVDDLQNNTVYKNQTNDNERIINATLVQDDTPPTKNTTLTNDDIENNKEHKQDINPKFKLYKNFDQFTGKNDKPEKYGKFIEEIHRAARGGTTADERMQIYDKMNEDSQKINEIDHKDTDISMKDYDTFVSEENNINGTHSQDYKYL